jgi:hypothetical protein
MVMDTVPSVSFGSTETLRQTLLALPAKPSLESTLHAHQTVTATQPTLKLCIKLARLRHTKLVHPPARHNLGDLHEPT